MGLGRTAGHVPDGLRLAGWRTWLDARRHGTNRRDHWQAWHGPFEPILLHGLGVDPEWLVRVHEERRHDKRRHGLAAGDSPRERSPRGRKRAVALHGDWR